MCRERKQIVRCRLGPELRWIYGGLLLVNDVVVDAVFHIGRSVAYAENPLVISFVLREKKLLSSLAGEIVVAHVRMCGTDSRTCGPAEASHLGSNCTRYPRPSVAVPQSRKQVQAGILQTAIVNCDAIQVVLRL